MRKSQLLIGLSMLVMIASFIMLGMRNDGERLANADGAGITSFEIEPESGVSVFVCVDESGEEKPPENIMFVQDHVSTPLELAGPRPLNIPDFIAADFQIETRQECGVSERFSASGADGDVRIESAPGAFVIAAVSSPAGTAAPVVMFFAFLAMILTGFALESTRAPRVWIPFRWYDGVAGFVAALMFAVLAASASARVFPSENTLFPEYGEMMAMVASNFLAFLAAYVLFASFRLARACRSGAPAVISAAPREEENDADVPGVRRDAECPRFRPWIALALGPALAATAAVTVSFAPLPGLSTLEMASQLVSTRFMSAYFAILAGVAEECLFRGLVQSGFEARPGSRHPVAENIFAVSVATALFVALHVPQSLDHLWALVPIALVSVAAGILKIRYRSLYPCILLHMSYNAALLVPSVLV